MSALAISDPTQTVPERRPLPHSRDPLQGYRPGRRSKDGPSLRGTDRDGRGLYRVVLRCTCELNPRHKH